jgi:fluoride ion exporter CrcB/FEX
MLETGNFGMMLLNSLGQVGLGLLGATFGVILARSIP